MSLENWPSTLPKPSINFASRTEAGVVRTKMDSGRYRQRRRFTAQQKLMQVRWELTDAQYTTFQSFHAYTINSGADAFNIDLAMGGGVQTYVARFIEGAYTAEYRAHMNWLITANLELTDQLPEDEGTAAATDTHPVDVGGVDIVVLGKEGYIGHGTVDTDIEVNAADLFVAGVTSTSDASVDVNSVDLIVIGTE